MAASTTRCSKSTSEGADAILRALAPIEWELERDGAGCPPERVPTTASLSAWLPECPADAWEAAANHAGGFHDAVRPQGGGADWTWRSALLCKRITRGVATGRMPIARSSTAAASCHRS